jgi:hypothetical protein
MFSKGIECRDGRCHVCGWYYNARAWKIAEGKVICPTQGCTYEFRGAYPWEAAPVVEGDRAKKRKREEE